jgi:hypothetical protein
MQAMKTVSKKMSLLLVAMAFLTGLGTWITPGDPLKPASDNNFTKELRKKAELYREMLPGERVYMQLDKPLYAPGDDVWFSAWIRQSASLLPSNKSDIITVELISPKGSVDKKIDLIASRGLAAGDFQLPDDAPGGLYKIKAYTQWMKNEGEDRCFIKEIQVQDVVLPALKMKLEFEKKAYGAGDEVTAFVDVETNENKPLVSKPLKYVVSLGGKELEVIPSVTDAEGKATLRFRLPAKLNTSDGLLNVMIDYNGSTESVSRSVPIVRNELKVAIYPEGGDLVSGIESRVAFRVVNEFGKAADVDAEICEENGKVINKTSSYHMGMGSFVFTPSSGKRYFLRVTRPEKINEKYYLPDALDRGYVMEVNSEVKNSAEVTVKSTESGEVALVASMRGKVLYTTTFPIITGKSHFSFSTETFPAGVLQVSLFDNKGVARAERLVFVNAEKKMSVSIRTEKQKYLPREKVRMNILVKDENGMPMPALLSMAVVNDQLLSFADDKSGNIMSQLLLQEDLREKVEEPSFYFDSKETKAPKALDLLMMTAGWRHFTWEQILEQEPVQPKYPGRRTLLTGSVIDGNTMKPLAGVRIKVQNDSKRVTTDENGHFDFSGLALYDPVLVNLEKQGYYSYAQQVYEYGEGITWYMYQYQKHDYRTMNAVPSMAPEMEMAALRGEARQAVNKGDGARREKAPVFKKAADKKAEGPKPAIARAAHAEKKMMALNGRADEFRFRNGDDVAEEPAMQASYYRAREFAAPLYNPNTEVKERNDFRNTIYWNPRIEVGYNGRASVEFYTSDDITSFKTIVEGIGRDGLAGRAEQNFFTQLPFELKVKIPSALVGNDIVEIPVTLTNNTEKPLGGTFSVSAPSQLEKISVIEKVQTLMPKASRTVFLKYRVSQAYVDTAITVSFEACALGDQVSQKVRIRPRGFPHAVSFSGQQEDVQYTFEPKNLVNNSMRISFSAYPDVISDLMKGVEGILQEPYGCFEQTSCTAYPNAMVLHYLKNSGNNDSRALARANDLLDRGYKRLTTFETSSKGYEWFGSTPAHEGLTAYGIMEFVDMQRAGQTVDKVMLDRTARWLLNHRDGKGGFAREKRALHDFGRISDDVMNGYIVYALADAGYSDLSKEYEHALHTASKSGDAYLMAMSAIASYKLDRKNDGQQTLNSLLKLQKEDGSFVGSSHSITFSQGRSLAIETTGLAIMAMIESGSPDLRALDRAVKFLISMRDGSGAFSSTQGTVLALKALTTYAIFNKRTKEDGHITIYIDGKAVAEHSYKAGERGEVLITGLEKFVTAEGKHVLRVKFRGVKNPLPYSVSATWNTTLPQSDKDCAVEINTKLMSGEVQVGATVRMAVTLQNKSGKEVPSAIAVIGIPAGLSVQPWQLKELQEKHMFDYYEIIGDRLALYYRGMEAKGLREIGLDLKAEMPGQFNFPASSAYLYYTNELKSWDSAGSITVKKSS